MFNAQLFTPRGARATDYLEIQIVNPSGVLTNRLTLAVTQVPDCRSGATQCIAPSALALLRYP